MLGEDSVPLQPVERFLAYLASIEPSPNTIEAYAHDLKDWFSFLFGQRLDWQAVTVEDVAGFVGWLRLPPAARHGQVAGAADRQPVLRWREREPQLAALTSSCELQARLGVPLTGLLFGLLLDTGMRIGRRSVSGTRTCARLVDRQVQRRGGERRQRRAPAEVGNTTRLVQSLLSCRSNRNGTGVPAATRTRFGE